MGTVLDSGVWKDGSGDSRRDGGFRVESPAGAEELAGEEEIASAMAIALVGISI